MRTTTLATAATALAVAALIAGAGTAVAQAGGPPEQGAVAGLVPISPPLGAAGSLGYGSFGTGSLVDLLSGVINTGSTTLSLDLPASTGSYAPGSTGSYGPEASIGDLFLGSLGSLGGAF